jgi:DNA-binding HxlR family transcriptional regulator
MAEAEEPVGFIISNARRRRVIEALSKGGEALDQLEKMSRVLKIMLEKILAEMAKKEIVKKTKAGYTPTPEGKNVARLLKSMH